MMFFFFLLAFVAFYLGLLRDLFYSSSQNKGPHPGKISKYVSRENLFEKSFRAVLRAGVKKKTYVSTTLRHSSAFLSRCPDLYPFLIFSRNVFVPKGSRHTETVICNLQVVFFLGSCRGISAARGCQAIASLRGGGKWGLGNWSLAAPWPPPALPPAPGTPTRRSAGCGHRSSSAPWVSGHPFFPLSPPSPRRFLSPKGTSSPGGL